MVDLSYRKMKLTEVDYYNSPTLLSTIEANGKGVAAVVLDG